MIYDQDILGESLETGKAAANWSKELKKRQEKEIRISEELMKKYTPLILQKKSESIDKA